MKKAIRSCLLVLLVATLLVCSTACTPYVSSFKALGLVRSAWGDHGSAQFKRLEGTLVFQLRMKGSADEGQIHYTVSLDEGEINLYYDSLGEKELLCNVKAGESIDDLGGYVEGGKKVYIIIETVKPSKGSVEVNLVK